MQEARSIDTIVPVGDSGVATLPLPSPTRARCAPNETVAWLLEGSGWGWLGIAIDATAVAAGAAAATGSGVPPHAGVAAAALALVALPAARSRARRLDAGFLDDVWPLLAAVSTVAMAGLALAALPGAEPVDPAALRAAWLTTLVLLVLGHGCAKQLRRAARLRGGGRRTVIVGAGAVGSRLGRRLASHPELGLRPVGFLDWEPLPADAVGGRPAPVVGTPDELERTVRALEADQVVLAFSSRPDAEVVPLLRRCTALPVDVVLVPRLFDHLGPGPAGEAVAGLPLIRLGAARKWPRRLKHAADRATAFVLLTLLAPLMALIATAILVTTGGPVLFRQRRVGRNDRGFVLLKFRTMAVLGAEELEPAPEPSLDRAPGGVGTMDRRSAVGRLLRRTSLDELPQLVNVLRGEMSLVGPRPERPEFTAVFASSVDRYAERHRVRTGITGLAQVRGLRGCTSLVERVELDNYYIDHWSLVLDLKILARTALAVFRVPE